MIHLNQISLALHLDARKEGPCKIIRQISRADTGHHSRKHRPSLIKQSPITK